MIPASRNTFTVSTTPSARRYINICTSNRIAHPTCVPIGRLFIHRVIFLERPGKNSYHHFKDSALPAITSSATPHRLSNDKATVPESPDSRHASHERQNATGQQLSLWRSPWKYSTCYNNNQLADIADGELQLRTEATMSEMPGSCLWE